MIDTSLQRSFQPRDLRNQPSFIRDLRQLGRFDKFVLHLQNTDKKRSFVAELLTQTVDDEIQRKLVPEPGTDHWYCRNGKYNYRTDTFIGYSGLDYVRTDRTINCAYPIVDVSNAETRATVERFLDDFCLNRKQVQV